MKMIAPQMLIAWARLRRAQVRAKMPVGVLGARLLLQVDEEPPVQAARPVSRVKAIVWRLLRWVVLLVGRQVMGEAHQTRHQAQAARTALLP